MAPHSIVHCTASSGACTVVKHGCPYSMHPSMPCIVSLVHSPHLYVSLSPGTPSPRWHIMVYLVYDMHHDVHHIISWCASCVLRKCPQQAMPSGVYMICDFVLGAQCTSMSGTCIQSFAKPSPSEQSQHLTIAALAELLSELECYCAPADTIHSHAQ